MCMRCDDPVPDPIPGDPDTVSRFARAFSDTAQALRDAARQLRAVANESITISLAIDEVRSKADEVDGDTARIAIRYQGAADAYSGYAAALASAQADGNGARNQILTNNTAARSWRHDARDLRNQVRFGNSDPQVLSDLADSTDRANYYDEQYANYAMRYSAAVEARDSAANTAIAILIEAEGASGLNDQGFDVLLGNLAQVWQLVSEYLGPVVELLRGIMEVLKQIVDILALIVTILSIFLPLLAPLAAGLSALSVLLSIAILAASALLFLMGRETLGRVLSDGIGALVSVVTSKLGGGSLFPVSQMTTGFAGAANAGRAAFMTGPSLAMELGVDVGATAAQKVLPDLIRDSSISAVGAVAAYGPGEAIDVSLAGPSPWGSSQPTSASLQRGTEGAVGEGLISATTFGAGGLVFDSIDTVNGAFPAIAEAWNETGAVWSQAGAVPAT